MITGHSHVERLDAHSLYYHLVGDFHVANIATGRVGTNMVLHPKVRTPHNRARKTPADPINDSYIPVGFVSLMRIKTIQGDIRHRVDDISNQFPAAGWKHLPQELVDEILSYLLDDPGALKACSLTRKCLFGAARPHMHQRLVCFYSRLERSKRNGWLFGRRKKVPGAFEQSIDVDCHHPDPWHSCNWL